MKASKVKFYKFGKPSECVDFLHCRCEKIGEMEVSEFNELAKILRLPLEDDSLQLVVPMEFGVLVPDIRSVFENYRRFFRTYRREPFLIVSNSLIESKQLKTRFPDFVRMVKPYMEHGFLILIFDSPSDPDADFLVSGVVKDKLDRPIACAQIVLFEMDPFKEDLLGWSITDKEGRFGIRYGEKQFKDLFEGSPELKLEVRIWEGDGRFEPVIICTKTRGVRSTEYVSLKIDLIGGSAVGWFCKRPK
ncbi:MAG: hypothetical protein DRQ10_02405 [Candidatus Hydrothermota bacterium]|nr:MAG: hypothetical protein DRQ10_02405 [Candidatus Hydrothermae bacterium]